MRRFMVGIFLALLAAVPAKAAWHEASSEHFVVYANQSPKTIQEFAETMERYHSALAIFYREQETEVSPSNRLTIFVVDSERAVRKVMGGSDKFVAGFYTPRAGSSIAVVPKIRAEGGPQVSDSERILLHEYAHHFMISNFGNAFPLWLTEGFAEFYSTAQFPKDGSVGLGLPATHRGYDLFAAQPVPMNLLLDTQAYRENKSGRYDAFYGRAWLLFHYLTFNKESRKGQLNDYIKRLAKGEAEVDAARAVFGDFKALDQEINRYQNKKSWTIFKVQSNKISIKPVTVRALSDGHAEMMPLIIRSRRGVDSEEAAEIVAEARVIAAKFSDDPAVMAALAEAEFDSGDDEAAITAADKALAVEPENMTALVQRTYALFRIAGEKDNETSWKQAVAQIVRTNRVDPNNPIPLMYYYRSFAEQGKVAPELAVQGIERALALAPYDLGLRLTVGQQMIQDKRYAMARYTLAPLAAHPHATEMASKVQAIIAAMPPDDATASSEHDETADPSSK